MFKDKFLKLGLCFFVVLFYVSAVLAQEKKCNFSINVATFEGGLPVENAKGTIVDVQSRSEFQAKTKGSSLIFLNLKEGVYEITVKKKNFKQSVYKHNLVCEDLDKEGFKSIKILLWEGNSEEKFDIAKQSPGIKTVTDRQYSGKVLKTGDLREIAKAQGILNFNAVYLEKPKYPRVARNAKAAGVVYVQITVDEKGKVESVKAIEGNPLLYEVAEDAAKKAKFKPTLVQGKPVKISGKLIYNFVL